ncbi:hypothetical protein MUB24_16180 [Lederbergia sp. NSJ-179]|uniref:hypothetical protein n=1 Tax=Lederbergia sp. NSJ-179 TaxID=2931402 RepID=UPI001FD13DFD|nr:hypothetical protein [Lederbergia sp. NSJ-179]MCJ7842407.1 hypothetical protein [Lederbergia sp. NSJ-179]
MNNKIIYDEFPEKCPPIHIQPLDKKTITVDFPELRWWFAIPEVGYQCKWAQYNVAQGALEVTVDMKATGEAVIHDIRGIEFEVTKREKKNHWKPEIMRMYARLTKQTVQWLAVFNIQSNVRILRTFLDEHFEEDWGPEEQRLITGDEKFGYTMANVRIGEQNFECLRVVEIDYQGNDSPDEEGILIETFISTAGRAVLTRRYNGRKWALKKGEFAQGEQPWDERYPDNHKIILEGQTYVHWYDYVPESVI